MRKVYIAIRYSQQGKAKGYILDISRGGIALAALRRIRRNTAVTILFGRSDFPLLRGRVMHTSRREKKSYPYRLGIRFISLNRKQKDFLTKFISQHLHKRRTARLNLI